MGPDSSLRGLLLGSLCALLGCACGNDAAMSNGTDAGAADVDPDNAQDAHADTLADASFDADDARDVEAATDADTGCPQGTQDNDLDGSCLPDCETSGLTCAAHAHCDDGEGTVRCVCDDGYQDHDANGSCLADCATAAPSCGANARCEDGGGVAACVCEDGFQDHDHDGSCLPTCATSGTSCSGHGTCSDGTGLATCECDDGYAGDDCGECALGHQDHDGDGICLVGCDLSNLACPVHGHCEDATGQAICVCDGGHTGTGCLSCAADYQDEDHDGICLPGCAIAGTVCSGPGSCSDASGETACVCDPGYQDHDADGTCLADCATASLVCQAGQHCEDWEGEARCVCPLGYTGDGCIECAEGFALELGACRPTHEWSVVVYMSADNDLEDAAHANLDQMAQVGSTESVHVVALLDTFQAGGHALYVENGGFTTVESFGEPDMGDWRTLRDLGIWAVRNYPAERYALILWDHGNGWYNRSTTTWPPATRGLSQDVHGERGLITVAGGELGRALQGISLATGNAKIDLIGFDACLMGMWEVARAVSPHADVMVASSEKEPQQGWPYEVVLTGLTSVPSMSAASWASWTVDAYHQASPLHYTLSAVDLQAVAGLDDEVSVLADALAAHPALFASIEGVRQQAQGFGDPAFRDMLDLSIQLGQMPSAPGEIVAASDALTVALQGAILRNRAQASHPGANGLSIYLPPSGGGLDCAYFDTDALWSASTRWDDLLAVFCHADCGI